MQQQCAWQTGLQKTHARFKCEKRWGNAQHRWTTQLASSGMCACEGGQLAQAYVGFQPSMDQGLGRSWRHLAFVSFRLLQCMPPPAENIAPPTPSPDHGCLGGAHAASWGSQNSDFAGDPPCLHGEPVAAGTGLSEKSMQRCLLDGFMFFGGHGPGGCKCPAFICPVLACQVDLDGLELFAGCRSITTGLRQWAA